MPDKDIMKLIREARRNGYTIEQAGNGHFKIRHPETDKVVAALPCSPNVSRIPAQRIMLEKAGVLKGRHNPKPERPPPEPEPPPDPEPQQELELPGQPPPKPQPVPMRDLLRRAEESARRFHVQGLFEGSPGDYEWRTWFIVGSRRLAAHLGRRLVDARVVHEFDVVSEWVVLDRYGASGIDEAYAHSEVFAAERAAATIVAAVVRDAEQPDLLGLIEDVTTEWTTSQVELELLIGKAMALGVPTDKLLKATGLTHLRLIRFRKTGRIYDN